MTITPKLWALLLLVFGINRATAQPLEYQIEIDPDVPKISVTVQFYHGENDTLYFAVPVRVNQSTGLIRNYRNLSVTGGRIVRKDSAMIIIKRTEKTLPTMQLHYDIFQISPGDAVTRTTSSAPIIQPDYIHIRGYSLFLTPLHYKNYDVTVNWKKVPKGWAIQNSFSAGTRRQQFLLNDREAWLRSNWVAGDFRQYQSTVSGKPVHFAVRGTWLFEDTTLFNVILKTVGAQREQWQDEDQPFYSVTLIPYIMPKRPVEWDAQSLCLGNGLYQSFVTYADPECLLDNFIDLFNHEMMHEWIGGKIEAGQGTETNNMRWFTEGFTEYFALRTRWKAGFLNEAAFFKELNKDYFADHYAAPFAELPNLEAEKRRWESFELERIAYRRGCIAAFYFDCAIRQRSGNQKSLFQMMTDLLEFTYGTSRDLTNSYDFFTETLGEYYGAAPDQWLTQHIYNGIKPAPQEFILPEFIQMKKNSDGVPQIGLSPAVKNAKDLFLKD